jgi:hypothetical protein
MTRKSFLPVNSNKKGLQKLKRKVESSASFGSS